MSSDLESRVSRLETHLELDQMDRDQRRKDLDARLEALDDGIKELGKELTSIAAELNRYKGFIGGVSLVISVAWAGVAFFKDHIVQFFSK